LEGELHDKWTRYKPGNAIERGYVWKLHGEPDLGVAIAPSALDYEGCYVDPTKKKKAKGSSSGRTSADDMDVDSEEEANDVVNKVVLPKLHPDDAKLIDWTGDEGDSVLKELERRRLRARALLTPGGSTNMNNNASTTTSNNNNKPSTPSANSFVSRVLRENTPFFMKKTTYLGNDQGIKVHNFKSLERSKTENAKDIRRTMEENKRKNTDKDGIVLAFDRANNTAKKPRRKHPVKRKVEAVYEIPFLPDGSTWGHTFTHVVVDHLPKKTAPSRKKNDGGRTVNRKMLQKAFIADVTQSQVNQRMECNYLLPDDTTPGGSGDGKEGGEDAVFYDAASAYDLDVLPLKEGGRPCVNFLLAIDERNGMATYHPLSSKVQLSTGRRPGDGSGGNGGKKRLGRYVGRREMGGEDVREMEGRLAEIDRDFKGDDDDEEEEVDEGDGMNGNQQDTARKSHSEFGDDDSDSDDGY